MRALIKSVFSNRFPVIKQNVEIYALIIVLVIATLTLCFGCAREPEEIRIGVILPLTGRAAKYAEDSMNGMALALNKINKSNKYPFILKVIYEDSKGNPSTAVSAFQKLREVDRVPIITGLILSNSALACAPIANSRKVVLLSTSASAEKMKDAGDFVFRLRESGIIHGKEMAKYARNSLKITNIAVIFANAENGITYSESFQKEFLSLGGKVLFSEGYNEGETDFRSLLIKAKSKNPEGLYLAGLAVEMGYILRQAREINFEPNFWLGSPGAENLKLIEIAEDASEGLIITSPPFNPNSKEKKVKDFIENYQKRYGSPPEVLAANGYDAIAIIAEIINKYGRTSEDVKNGLYKVKNFQGIGGEITFDEFGEVQKPVLFKKIHSKRFIILE